MATLCSLIARLCTTKLRKLAVERRGERPKTAIETFQGKATRPGDTERVAVDTEDYGSVLLHFRDEIDQRVQKLIGELLPEH